MNSVFVYLVYLYILYLVEGPNSLTSPTFAFWAYFLGPIWAMVTRPVQGPPPPLLLCMEPLEGGADRASSAGKATEPLAGLEDWCEGDLTSAIVVTGLCRLEMQGGNAVSP